MSTKLDDILHDWAQTKLPDNEIREAILRNVLGQKKIGKRPTPKRHHQAGWITAAAIAAVMLLFVLDVPQQDTPIVQKPPVVTNIITKKEPIQVSLLVLRHLPNSDTAVEFLEDTVLVTEDQKVNTLDLNGHKFYLWFYKMEPGLFTVDVVIDDITGTDLIVSNKTRGLHLKSEENEFDVFVSL
ncbi:MAG: hypothetical protein LBQ54_10355 [Planctomycetaceae bacterium]|nr:hypothetical protein [Planctomycetaceae bacterium]